MTNNSDLQFMTARELNEALDRKASARAMLHVIQIVDGAQVLATKDFDHAKKVADSHRERTGQPCRIEERRTVYETAGASPAPRGEKKE